ncbi:34781_t:CDS:1, partial [Racocetra persica]
WLRYMLLIKLFTAPRSSSRLISLELLSPGTSFVGNKHNFSTFYGKNDPDKLDINLDNQNDNQDIDLIPPEPVHLKDSLQYPSLDLLSHCFNSTTSTDPLIGSSRSNQTNISNTSNTRAPLNSTTNTIDIPSNYTVSDDEGRIDVVLVNGENHLKRSYEKSSDDDLSQEIETYKLLLKRL